MNSKQYHKPEITGPGDGYVQNPDGTYRATRNLRPLLNRARVDRVTFLCVTPIGTLAAGRQASLEVHFASGHKFVERFASYHICLAFAENPRRAWNLRGDLH